MESSRLTGLPNIERSGRCQTYLGDDGPYAMDASCQRARAAISLGFRSTDVPRNYGRLLRQARAR